MVSGKHAGKKITLPSLGNRRGKRVADENESKRSFFFYLSLALGMLTLTVGGFLTYLYSHPELPMAKEYVEFGVESETLCEPFLKNDINCRVDWVKSEFPVGVLVEQSPGAGSRANDVTLKYSIGPSTVNVPILSGLPMDEARELIWASGLTMGEVKETDSPAPKGSVVSSSLTPASEVANGTKVDLFASNGLVYAPNWLGKTKEFITAEAARMGLKIKFETKVDNKKPQDIVTKQSIYGKRIANTDTLVVTLSKKSTGKESNTPNVVGMTQEEAISTLAASGFTKIKTLVVENNKIKKSRVTKMSPAQGKKANLSSEVTLTVEKPIE